MITPVFTVTVSDENVLVHLTKLTPALRTNVSQTIAELTYAMLAQVRGLEPTRTGQLRASTRAFVDINENLIRGRVRVLGGPRLNIAFAALEYGAHRTFTVRPYERQGIAVRAYQRTANIQAQRFLRGPAAAMRERALAAIKAAVDKSVEESEA